MGKLVRFERLRANARVDCARGLSRPSRSSGSPRTIPAMSNSEKIAVSDVERPRRRRPRGSVFKGEARRRSMSEIARPIVFDPRSMPIKRALGGRLWQIFDCDRTDALARPAITAAIVDKGDRQRRNPFRGDAPLRCLPAKYWRCIGARPRFQAFPGASDVRRSQHRPTHRASCAHRRERSRDAAFAKRDQRHSQVRRSPRRGRCRAASSR